MEQPHNGEAVATPPSVRLMSIQDYVADDTVSPFTITIAGAAGIGKTSLALSLAEVMPVYFLETEHRFQYLAKKMQHSLLEMPYPIHAVTVNDWPQILEALGQIKVAVRSGDPTNPGAIVIDSGTDFKNFADYEWRKTSKTFPPTNYSKLYKMMNGIVAAIKKLGLSVVFTNRLKAHYVDDSWDGETMTIDMFKNQDYLSEAVLILNEDATITVDRNKWHDATQKDSDSRLLSRDMGLPTIIETLQQ